MTRWLTGWLPLLRIARRDAIRARGRSVLIMAMIALPVLALTGVDVLARSAQLDPDESLTRTLGATQARLEGASGPVQQAPNPDDGWVDVQSSNASGPGTSDADTAPPEQVDPAAVAPAGYRLLTSQDGGVRTRTATGVAQATWNEVAVGEAAFAGRFRVLEGRAANDDSEVGVTPALLDRLGLQVGDAVELTSPAGTYTVTGVVAQVGSPADEAFWAAPGTLLGAGVDPYGPPSVYLVGDRPVTWDHVLALNEQGVVVASRAVIASPPPDAAVPYLEDNDSGSNPSDAAFLVLLLAVIVVLGGLEVTLLAGAAFAVGARRQARSLGLLAAAGGTSTHVRRVVLSGGLVLGAAGAVTGIALGMALAAAAMPFLERLAGSEFGRFDVRPLEVLAIAGVGVATGLLSAVLPARTAARQDLVVALTGRRGQVGTPRKVPVIGLVLTALGVGAAALGSALAVTLSTGLNPTSGLNTALVAGLIAGGAGLAQIGLIVTSPAIIGLAGRLSSRLPLPGRLALRDAARHRGRSAPAMAAVLTAVTGSTALLLYVTSLDASDREAYQATWPDQTGGISLLVSELDPATGTYVESSLDADRVRGLVADELPPFTSYAVDATDESCLEEACSYISLVTPEENRCFLDQLERLPTGAETKRAEADWRCRGYGGYANGGFSGTPVGGADTLVAVAGTAPAEAVRVLEAGGVAVFDRSLVLDGTVILEMVSAEQSQAAMDEGRQPVGTRVELPGVHVPTDATAAPTVYSTGAAQRLGLDVRPSTLLMSFDRVPTTGEEDAARGALEEAGIDPYLLSVERGYTSDYGLGLLALVVGAGVITLGAAGVSTGLAQADARADHATLAAIGAAPRLRRTLAAAQALTIAGLGTALGIAAGFVPAVALIGAVASLDLVIPWVRLLTVLVVIPVLAGVLAWLFTRSRVPLERRVA